MEGQDDETKSDGDGMTRGYTMLNLSGIPSINGAGIDTNVLIKKQLPVRGLVSSNPKRAERLLRTLKAHGTLENIQRHTDAGWGIKIWTAIFHGVEFFIAVVPIGSTGAGFAFFEMYSAGAQAILRFGAGSDRNRDSKHREVVVVDQATNMDNLQYAAGKQELDRKSMLQASEQLVRLLEMKAAGSDMPSRRMVCYNVEDYHAYNFSELFEEGDAIRARIVKIEETSEKEACRDMETAALFWRAHQFGLHAATVLVPVQATADIEREYYILILESLYAFIPQSEKSSKPSSHSNGSLSRSSRRHSTNDLIGIEEPLFLVEDVETGNNLFAD